MATVANTTIRVTDQATPSLRNINIALTANLTGFERLERAINDNTAALNRARSSSGTYTISQRRAAAATREHASASEGLISKLKGVAAAYLGVQTAQRFMAESDAFINNQARLNTMNDGLQTTDELYQKLYSSAQRSLAPISDVTANVSKLGIVAGDAFKSNDEIIAFVETFNKAATVSGASNSEKSNAMYQLSQAFASGRLQGDELRSVRENAPMLYKSIQKELERTFGEGVDFKKLAADGLITPDVIKRAAFNSAGEIDEAFKNMPMTFGDTMLQAFNKVKMAMTPIFKEMQKTINSPGFKTAINGITNFAIKAISGVWSAIKWLVKAISGMISFIKWASPVLKPLAIAVGTLVGLTYAYIGAIKLWGVAVAVARGAALLFGAAKMVLGFATSFATTRTLYQTAAQWGLNKAQMVGLAISLKVILIILAIVAVIALLIYFFDYVSAAAHVAGTAILNTVLGVYNGFLSILDMIINPVVGIIEWLYNAFTGGFNSIGDACLNILGQIVAFFLGVLKPILEVWDYVTGDNVSAKVSGLQDKARNWGKNEKAKTFDKDILRNNFGVSQKYRVTYGDAWDTGKSQGEAAQKSLKSQYEKMKNNIMPDMKIPGIEDLDKMGMIGEKGENPYLAEIAKNTGATAENTAQQKEDDYKMLRDVMAQRVIERVGSNGGTVKVEMVNNNTLSSQLDVNGFMAQLANTIEEAASTGAKGLHN